ncbi:unnamed protein product [Caenorhabditis auriculariae]|uniref:Uncharacterized protein n=1 Tax=Caenorhabditis auriculariae TaxID=2777116 RepID=A0A8S1HX70_9PELO|nr:unnamed protein product [Caenorhabditis auriculariae]
MTRCEAVTLINRNHTMEWFRSLSPEEQNECLDGIRKETGETLKSAGQKRNDLAKRCLEYHREKCQNASKKMAKESLSKRQRTETLFKHGFWQQKSEMESSLSSYKSEREKWEALSAQLRFRQRVLLQKHADKKFYVLTAGGKKISLAEMKLKLLSLFENDQKGDNLVVLAYEHAGKSIEHTFFDEEGKKNSWKGRVVEVQVRNGGEKAVLVLYENEKSTTALTLAEFEQAIEDGLVVFL